MGERIIIRGDRSTLESVEELRGVKAESLADAEGSHHPPAARTAQRVSGIVEDGDPSIQPDALQRLRVARAAIHMHTHDRRCTLGDQAAGAGWIDAQRLLVDVAKDGLKTEPADGVS